ncbi:MAG TPA: class I SAM-dependent methyltransferase [Syntrophobacteraceae bacterium]|nr:class I SAM-dependent methyltransferase [Syntrophobacteraceae bacterium]
MFSEKCRLYENPALREAGEGLIRPGGLELTQRAVALSGLRPGALVLDVGCGTGATLRYLTERCALRAIGIDLSIILAAEGHAKKPDLLFVLASAHRLPFTDSIMDAVLAECSLSLMESPENVLDECSKVLKPGGSLLVHDVYAHDPHEGAKLQETPFECCMSGAVSKEQWLRRLEGGGFAVAFWEDHSQALKEFAARLIFSQVSLEHFLRRLPNTTRVEQCPQIRHAVSLANPGYFLAVARKIHRESTSD